MNRRVAAAELESESGWWKPAGKAESEPHLLEACLNSVGQAVNLR